MSDSTTNTAGRPSVSPAVLPQEALEEMWRQSIHNKVFEMRMDCQELRKAFEILLPKDYWGDPVSLFERQLRIVECEVQNLVTAIGRVKVCR